MISQLIFTIALLQAAQAGATSEKTLIERFDTEITTFAQLAETGKLSASDGTALGYRIFRTINPPKGGIVLLPGYTESYEKYSELAVDLTQAGYDLFALDHRGMGRSARLATNRQIVHVARFEDYVSDTQQFIAEVVQPRQRGELYILAHSTGALIAANVLRNSTPVKAAAFSAPLFEINLKFIPDWLAYFIASVNIRRGAAADYVPGQKDFDLRAFDPTQSSTTTSHIRASLQKQLLLNNQELTQSGPSNQWLREAIRASWQREELARNMSIPILILTAEDDRFVKRGGQVDFCKIAKYCRMLELGRGSRHELLMERDEIRDDVLKEILAHFAH